jgi:hypothetical protein
MANRAGFSFNNSIITNNGGSISNNFNQEVKTNFSELAKSINQVQESLMNFHTNVMTKFNEQAERLSAIEHFMMPLVLSSNLLDNDKQDIRYTNEQYEKYFEDEAGFKRIFHQSLACWKVGSQVQ